MFVAHKAVVAGLPSGGGRAGLGMSSSGTLSSLEAPGTCSLGFTVRTGWTCCIGRDPGRAPLLEINFLAASVRSAGMAGPSYELTAAVMLGEPKT